MWKQKVCDFCKNDGWVPCSTCDGVKYKQRVCVNCAVKASNVRYTHENKEYWIECPLCNYRARDLSTHYKTHNLTKEEYKKESKLNCLKSTEMREHMSGDHNPAHNHGGKLSPWSSKSICHDISKVDERKLYATQQLLKSNKENNNNQFLRSYYSSDEEYRVSQTRNLSWFIGKYGELNGKKKHAEKTEKWIKSFKKQNYSKISQELFDEIIKSYNSSSIYYATFDRLEMSKYKNKEFRLMLEGRGMLLDFVDVETKKVIEFDGDYWHSESRVNPIRENERELLLKNAGFDVLRIKEREYKKDREGTVLKCIQFLTQ